MASALKNPAFLISIDTEMLWGGGTPSQRKVLVGKAKEDRDAVTDLLAILEKHEIKATWAVVGHLFLDHCDEATCPTARNRTVHDYRPDWYWDPHSDLHRDPMYYGKDVVEKILSAGTHQELGYHSFSHPSFTDISREMAEEELAQANKIERDWGIRLRSFVFPRNEVAHLDLLCKHGFTIFRGELAQRRKEEMGPWNRKVNGALDKLFARPVGPTYHDGIWEIPASMPFADAQMPGSIPFRAKYGLKRAIRTGQVFHVCLHPWNLVITPRLKRDLDAFLGQVARKRKEGEIDVLTMGEYASQLTGKMG